MSVEPVALDPPAGNGVLLLFQPVSEPKTVKNRVHLDLKVEDIDAEVERLTSLGARKLRAYREPDAAWTIMADPEGNEFCVM